jgi:hypothetical protein
MTNLPQRIDGQFVMRATASGLHQQSGQRIHGRDNVGRKKGKFMSPIRKASAATAPSSFANNGDTAFNLYRPRRKYSQTCVRRIVFTPCLLAQDFRS